MRNILKIAILVLLGLFLNPLLSHAQSECPPETQTLVYSRDISGVNHQAICASNSTGLVVPISSPINTPIISPLSYGAVADAVPLTGIDLSQGGASANNLVCAAGCFTAANNVKIGNLIVCMLPNDNVDGLALSTILTVSGDGTKITVTGTIARAFANQNCIVSSTNSRIAFLNAESAMQAGFTFQLPCGHVFISGGDPFANLTAKGFTNNSQVNIAGCPNKGTIIHIDWPSYVTNSTRGVLTGFYTSVSDITFLGPGPIGTTWTPSLSPTYNSLVAISGNTLKNIEVDDVNVNGMGCITAVSDGSMWDNVFSQNCWTGQQVLNRQLFLINTTSAQQITGVGGPGFNFAGGEDGDRILGGFYGGSNGATCSGIFATGEGVAANYWLFGTHVSAAAGNPGLCLQNGGIPINAYIIGGRYGGQGNNVIGANTTAINIAVNQTLVATDAQLDNNGTGFSINNTGTYIDNGGNSYNQYGNNPFTGTGVFILSCTSFRITSASGFNSTASTPKNPCAFQITVGTGTATSTGTITFTIPAPHGWICNAQNQTRADLITESNNTTTTCVLTNFGTTFAATNFTNSDLIDITAIPF